MIRLIWLGWEPDWHFGGEWIPLKMQYTPTKYRGAIWLGFMNIDFWIKS